MANELIGVEELTRKLNRLDSKLAAKSLRSSLFKATTPVVRQMQSRIPVGTDAHRTYKGRLVVPGFARRSVKRLTGKKFLNRGRISVAIGVKAEAYYAIRFYDQGPYTITRRRQSTNIRARGHVGNQRRNISIKPYTLRRVPWFESTFAANETRMVADMKKHLRDIITKVARSG